MPALAAAAAALIILTGCTAVSAPKPTHTAAAPTHAAGETVTYEVSSDAHNAMTIEYLGFDNGSNGPTVVSNAALPFDKVVGIVGERAGKSRFFSLVATAATGSTMTCKIIVDGKVVSQQTVSQPDPTVSCGGDAS